MSEFDPLTPPVITIDGPAGVGKGTLGQRLAREWRWHFLDSGAIYRVLAFAVLAQRIDLQNESEIAHLATRLAVSFVESRIEQNGIDIAQQIRTENVGHAASVIGALPTVRAALLAKQRQFRQSPGLIADGRDMGTVVFPDATHKIFLTANIEIRAQRRYNQLSDKGLAVNLNDLIAEIAARDARDQSRSTAPLKAATGAFVLDTSFLNPDQVWQQLTAFLTTSDWPTPPPRLRPSTPT